MQELVYIRAVAKTGIACVSGTQDRGFKSLSPDQLFQDSLSRKV